MFTNNFFARSFLTHPVSAFLRNTYFRGHSSAVNSPVTLYPMQSLLVLAVLASADCLALRAPARCGRPCMAAKKRAKQINRREALSGGGFDSDAAYKDIANAGLREPLLFGGIAVTAAFGLSRRGQLVETLTALDAAQPHKTTGDRLPVTAVAAAKAKFKVEVSGALL